MTGKRLPTAIHVLRGNAGRRPLPANEPKPPVRSEPPPRFMGAEAKREWRRMMTVLVPLGLYTPADRAVLAGYCESWSLYIEAMQALRRFGTVVKSPNGMPMASPYWTQARQAEESMRAAAREFGLTPSSRTRVSAGAPAAEDAFEELLRGSR